MGKLTPHEEMYEFLTGGARVSRVMRDVFRHIPHGPNCKICAAPRTDAAIDRGLSR